MKKNIIPLFLTALLILSSCSFGKKKNNTISISGAWALYPMAIRWAEEYRKIHPEIRIDISAGGAGKGIADVLGGLVDIGMVSREINPEELKRGALPIAVAKDAVVPVVNENNPALKEILDRGLSREAGSKIWITGDYSTWDEAFGTSTKDPIHVYTRSDACGAAEIWALFFGTKQEDLLGVGVYGDPGLAQAVKQDSLGMGFNNIGYVYDNKTKLQIPGLKIVPLDMNNNGRIDEDERFYNSMDAMISAIASGKYPSPPARELYFVLKGKPGDNKVLMAFMIWVLSEGQKYVDDAGYVALSNETIASGLKNLQ
jgi:phosphate transport system substrate-binding protein